MAANRKGIGPTTLKRACNSTANTCTKYLLVVMHKTLCSVWLTFVRRENETVQNCPIVLQYSSSYYYYYYYYYYSSFAVTHKQATELTQKRLQIAPPILITFHIKKDTRHVQLEFQETATVSYSTRHRNSTNDSK